MAKNEPHRNDNSQAAGQPTTQHRDFYESRPATLPLDACEVPEDEEQPVSKVTTAHGGAKRDSAFKRRDYK